MIKEDFVSAFCEKLTSMFWFFPFEKKEKPCSTRKLLTHSYVRLYFHKNNAL